MNLTPSTGNRQSDELLMVHTLGNLVCSAMKRQAYVSLMKVGPDGSSYISVGGWAGGQPTESSRAPFVATSKAAELLYYGDRDGLMLTPIPDFEFSTGWKGGARLGQDIVGVSKWAEEHDLLLALILLHFFVWETRLHHIGWRMQSKEAWQEACGKEAEAGFQDAHLPADDHLRMYFWHPDNRSGNGGYHTEYQFFPDGPQTPAVHIDLAVGDPDRFLRFVANPFNLPPIIWDDDPNGPYGAVWVTGKDGSIMGVMARDRWNYFVPNTDPRPRRIATGRP